MEKAKKARAEARKLREEQARKRKRIQASNDKSPKLDEDAAPTPSKKSKQDSADTQKKEGKKVTAGLAVTWNATTREETGAQCTQQPTWSACTRWEQEYTLMNYHYPHDSPSPTSPALCGPRWHACAHLRTLILVCSVVNALAVQKPKQDAATAQKIDAKSVKAGLALT